MTKGEKPDETATVVLRDGSVNYSVGNVLSRLRSTVANWVTTLTSVAAVIFTGVSLSEFVKSPANADSGLAQLAMLCLGITTLGALVIIFASGWASSQRPHDGAFNDETIDPLRFFPSQTAKGLLGEYVSEVSKYNAARREGRIADMNESARWIESHAKNLWSWQEAYRARNSAWEFKLAASLMFSGAVLVGFGAINFANILRQLKATPPSTAIVVGPIDGTLQLLNPKPVATKDKPLTEEEKNLLGLYACAAEDKVGDREVSKGKLSVTVISVDSPSAALKKNKPNVAYVSTVVPPLMGIAEKGNCVVKSYTVDSTQAVVSVSPVSLVPPTAEVEATTATTKHEQP